MAVGLALVSGCEGGWPGAVPATANPNVPKDEHLAVDCAADANASAEKKILVGRYVQILMLNVKGQGYDDAWRVQLFPGDSDVRVSLPNGQPPERSVDVGAMTAPDPAAVALTHGALSVQRTNAEAPSGASPVATPSEPIAPSRPAEYFNYNFMLTCTTFPGALPVK